MLTARSAIRTAASSWLLTCRLLLLGHPALVTHTLQPVSAAASDEDLLVCPVHFVFLGFK
jgi:hypothetical protein